MFVKFGITTTNGRKKNHLLISIQIIPIDAEGANWFGL
jgi:hypothetical protein